MTNIETIICYNKLNDEAVTDIKWRYKQIQVALCQYIQENYIGKVLTNAKHNFYIELIGITDKQPEIADNFFQTGIYKVNVMINWKSLSSTCNQLVAKENKENSYITLSLSINDDKTLSINDYIDVEAIEYQDFLNNYNNIKNKK